ncbi:MAG TPA: arginine deiminase-related protein [Saprospiraceae bacterium]
MPIQTTSRIIMVRPAAFGYNVETAVNNTFQHVPKSGQEEIKTEALREFDQLVSILRQEGVEVEVVQDSVSPVKPDAIFPNNWISFHEDGTLVTYPMYAPLRRQERREEIVAAIEKKYKVTKRVSLEHFEGEGHFLEGTGSMVLDRVNKIAYACISQRTDPGILQQWGELMGYTPFSFAARYDGQDIYHTNVMMAIGDGVSIVCLDVVEEARREALYQSLSSAGREVVVLRADQVGSFAGNMLAVRTKDGQQLMVMSRTAHESLDVQQRKTIERYARIVSSDVNTIETIGGGSVRCMIAENFLPTANLIKP